MFFPGVPKNKTRDKHPKLVEDVTFKGVVNLVFKRLSNIAFYSVGASKSPSHEVPKLIGERASIQEIINSFLVIHAKNTYGWTKGTFTR